MLDLLLCLNVIKNCGKISSCNCHFCFTALCSSGFGKVRELVGEVKYAFVSEVLRVGLWKSIFIIFFIFLRVLVMRSK